MAENKSIRLEKRQIDGAERMVDVGLADNRSEALRAAADAGFEAYGITPNSQCDTRLRETARRLAFGFAMVGAVLMGLVYFGSLTARLFGIVPWVMALACYGVDRGLARVEPRVSLRLGTFLGGEKA